MWGARPASLLAEKMLQHYNHRRVFMSKGRRIRRRNVDDRTTLP